MTGSLTAASSEVPLRESVLFPQNQWFSIVVVLMVVFICSASIALLDYRKGAQFGVRGYLKRGLEKGTTDCNSLAVEYSSLNWRDSCEETEALSVFKKCTTWKFWVKFYLEQNEDYRPGDSTSESSEKLLQRDRGGRKFILVKGEYVQSRTFFFFLQKVSASHGEQMSPWRNLVLS